MMNKNIYIIRHCEAEGQPSDSPLTEKGLIQSYELLDFLSDFKVDRIVCSPFVRAIQSIKPFADRMNLEVEIDNRLIERVLSSSFFPDWLDKLEATFTDLDLTYEGGESSNAALKRIMEVVEDVIKSGSENTVIVAHGGLISLLLNHYDKNFGFEQWKALSNPDVIRLRISKEDVHIQRLWKDSGC